jgi:hypothetical protein
VFEILKTTRDIEGIFVAWELPALAPGLAWSFPGYDLSGSNTFTLSVESVAGIPGDFNIDGDGEDFLKW